MTPPRKTPRRTKLERHREEVIGLIVLGYTDSQIARFYGTSRQGVGDFHARHEDAIAERNAAVDERTASLYITKKENRLRDAQLRRDLMLKVIEARGAGGSGIETGIVTRTYKWAPGQGLRKLPGAEGLESAEDLLAAISSEPYEEYRVDTALLAEWRANDEYVAEQQGEIPRGKGAGIDLSKNSGVVIVRGGPDLGV